MYKLVRIKEAMRTRFLTLENMDTGTVDDCFDDSDVVNDDDFSFMRLGEIYDCKIKLFGNVIDKEVEGSTFCRITDENVMVGKRNLVKVETDEGTYYVLEKNVKDHKEEGYFYFLTTRKDLIQVDDVIHGDYL